MSRRRLKPAVFLLAAPYITALFLLKEKGKLFEQKFDIGAILCGNSRTCSGNTRNSFTDGQASHYAETNRLHHVPGCRSFQQDQQ